MLDRLKLGAALSTITPHLFADDTDVIKLALQIYQQCADDPAFIQRAADAQSSFLVPSWQGALTDVITVSELAPAHYTTIATDGSQVYPDRHIGNTSCFLLNTGSVVLRYGRPSSAQLNSEPRICTRADVAALSDHLSFGSELVDLMREDDELAALAALCQQYEGDSPLALVDGTLIFWNLEGKSPEVRRFFLQRYLMHLQSMYERTQVCAGYISLPKSRELINLVKLGLCRFKVANCIPCHASYNSFPCKQVDQLIDTQLVEPLLQPGQRTTLFASNSTIATEYPAHLRPWFCYLHVGYEIVRLEMPAWVAQDQQLLERICQVVLDQCEKGNGYPVVLAEAHEQAVVKSSDKEFFYHLINSISIKQNRASSWSRKQIKKRRAVL